MNDLMPAKRFQLALVALATTLAILFGPASGARAEDAVSVSTYVIEASDGVPGVDSAIRHIVKQFHGAFRYSTYKLVSKTPSKIPIGKSTKITLPGKRTLTVSALGYEGGRIRLKVKIVEKSAGGKSRDVLATEFRLVKGGTIVLADYNYNKGKLILAISADM